MVDLVCPCAADLQRQIKATQTAQALADDYLSNLNAVRTRIVAFAGQLQAWGHIDAATELMDEILIGPVHAPDYDAVVAERDARKEQQFRVDTAIVNAYMEAFPDWGYAGPEEAMRVFVRELSGAQADSAFILARYRRMGRALLMLHRIYIATFIEADAATASLTEARKSQERIVHILTTERDNARSAIGAEWERVLSWLIEDTERKQDGGANALFFAGKLSALTYLRELSVEDMAKALNNIGE